MIPRAWTGRLLLIAVAAVATLHPSGIQGAPGTKRIAFLVDSWYPRSHADVIGTRFLEGYRVGDRRYASMVTVASVYAEAPRPSDQTRALSSRFGFRVAASVAEALLEDPRAARPRLAVDGILVATRADPPPNGQDASPSPRLQLMREVFRILDQADARVPIFIDKMLATNQADAQAIVAGAAQRSIPLMAGSVLPFIPLDRPMRAGTAVVGVVVGAGPYWAYAFHAAELLQGYMEQRGPRETGVASIRGVSGDAASLSEGEQWGGSLLPALLSSAKTRGSGGGRRESPVFLQISYLDGARGLLALLPRAFDEAEFLLGAKFQDGGTSIGGVMLKGEPFDHFGYLVHALQEFYTTGRPPVPVERTLLTTGIVLLGQEARLRGTSLATPGLAIRYPAPRWRP